MRALDRKRWRDLWEVKGQALAIMVVIAAGVAMYCMYLATFDSLREIQRAYYDRYRFADVFAAVERAPNGLAQRMAAIPGVARVETRVVVDVTLEVAGFGEPARGRLVSLPPNRETMLNALFVRRGRLPDPGRADEAVVHEAFALAHGLGPGDRVAALINGRRRVLRIVAVGLSPEFVYTIPPAGFMPDDRRYGVLWLDGQALATAFDLEGSFNDVVLRLGPGADETAVIEAVDRTLEAYGGLGAVARAHQTSHWFVANELKELETFGTAVPVVFLAVAAFLLHVVLSRLVAVQRGQVAALKALGYGSRAIGWHYVGSSLIIAASGVLVGVAAGAWLGHGMTRMYNDYFRFPLFTFVLAPRVVWTAAAVGLASAAFGAADAVRRVVSLPPAEAMRPEPPASFRPTLLERFGVGRFRLGRLLGPPARMVLRNLRHRPARSALSILGVGCAVAMLVVGSFFLDAIEQVMHLQFEVARQHDVIVTFVRPSASAAGYELRRFPGVVHAEPFRVVAATLRAGPRSRRVGLRVVEPERTLERIIDRAGRRFAMPRDGLVLSVALAEILEVGRGDRVTVEVLEGDRRAHALPVTGLVDETMGLSAYLTPPAARALLREGGVMSGVDLAVDSAALPALFARLAATPGVAGVAKTRAALESFRATLAKSLWLMIVFNVGFAGVIAVGVVYNSARIVLAERQRDLASLRVLGFTRAEISSILLGELAVLTLAAIPTGLVLGRILAQVTLGAFDNELFRLPLVIEPSTYGYAAATVLIAATLSALGVRRRLDRLDLVAVLKTRES